jgi:hypothetical protein
MVIDTAKTYIATPSPQSTSLTTKFTAGIHPAAHSFFSRMIEHPSAEVKEAAKRAHRNSRVDDRGRFIPAMREEREQIVVERVEGVEGKERSCA